MEAVTPGVETAVAYCPPPLAFVQALVAANQTSFPPLGLQIAAMVSPASSTHTTALAVVGQHVYLWGHIPQSQFIPPMTHMMVGSPSLCVSS